MASAKQTSAPNIFQGETATVQDVGTAGIYMTPAQGAGIVDAGLAQPDTSNLQGDAAFVTLTDAGLAQLNGTQAPAPVAPTPTATITVRNDIPVPTKRNRQKGASKYPIDTMEVGQSFHVASTPEDEDPANRIASTIAMARAKYATPVTNPDGSPVMVEQKVKTYQKADGKFVKDANGKRVLESESTKMVQETKHTRDWLVSAVGDSDPDGKGCRVWRTA